MNPKLSLPTLLALVSSGVGTASAQALPTTQPAYLTIVREEVKLGRGAEHTRIEAGWPAAFAKAKSPSSYLALASLTGQDEVWFTIPFASNAAVAEEFKRQDADPVLSAELARLARADLLRVLVPRIVRPVRRPEGRRRQDRAGVHGRGAGSAAEVLGRGACQLGDEPLPARSGDELRVAGDAGAGSRVLDAEEAGRARDHTTVRHRALGGHHAHDHAALCSARARSRMPATAADHHRGRP